MSVTANDILSVFDEAGLRNTRPRRLIAERLAALDASGTVFTMDDFWREVQQADPHVGRATVYRAVELLVERGLLDRVEFADGSHRYHLSGASHHHHLTCTQCHQMVEIALCLPADQVSAIASQANFDIEGHSLELFGRCARCREA